MLEAPESRDNRNLAGRRWSPRVSGDIAAASTDGPCASADVAAALALLRGEQPTVATPIALSLYMLWLLIWRFD
jgi:hypothetical protein